MTKFIVLAFYISMSGCAALTRLNTFKYDGKGKEPVIVERLNSSIHGGGYITDSPGSLQSWDSRILKTVTVSNPLDKEIEVTVECSSMMQGDLEFSIPPHSSQDGFVESTRRNAYNDTCRILEWEVK